MKKVLALVMALVLCAVSFAAFADPINSPTSGPAISSPTEGSAISSPAEGSAISSPTEGSATGTSYFVVSDDLIDAVAEMAAVIASGDSALNYFDDETKTAIAAVVGEDVEVKEAVMLWAVEAPVMDHTLTISFDTAYAEGEVVALAIGFVENADWTVLEGKGTADGSVTVTLPAELVTKLNDAHSLVYVLSAK